MSTQPTTEVSRSEAVESLLLDMTDLKNRAECSLNFAYETLSILTRGVKEGSEKHVQAALVNLDSHRIAAGGILGIGPEGIVTTSLTLVSDLRETRPLFR